MTLFTRALARDFRALLARCTSGRPRGPAPPVVVQTRDDVRTLSATTAAGVTLTHASPAPEEPDDLLVLASVLVAVEGGSDEMGTFGRSSPLRGVVRWHGAEPRTLPVELILPGKQHELPTPPALSAVRAQVLSALHECGRTAAKERGRVALSRVQVRGDGGCVIGTDGKAALVWGGFAFPFPGAALVPAVPVFGPGALARAPEVRVGRTASHLVVSAGPWAVWLPADARARYPDVRGVIPAHPPTRVALDVGDVAHLLKKLPGGDREPRPVTLDAGTAVRVLGTRAEPARHIDLTRSSRTGPPARVALDRRPLARALRLGCRALELTPANRSSRRART